jgi:hypothetical protein
LAYASDNLGYCLGSSFHKKSQSPRALLEEGAFPGDSISKEEERMKSQNGRYIALVALICLLCGTYAWPQAGTGELTGMVTDPTGAVIVGATLELSNSDTGSVRSTITSAAGVYRFVALPVVGTYSLSIRQAGFKAFKVEGISISVGTTVTRDIRLEVGAPSETISVVGGGAELVQTTESAVSTLIDKNIWQNMPLEVRSQNAFIDLVAGAVPDDFAGNTRGAAVNGARGGAGNYMVEGVDNNDQGQGGRGQLGDDPGGASTSISPDAIGEYRVITNSFAAEYGKAGGFVTDTVMKSGTNKFHGSLFEYNRVQALAAQNFFTNASGEKDSLVRNQFGGSIGGPIIKDKLFFFYSMEWHRMRQTSPLYAVGTTQQFLDWVDTGGLQSWAENDLCMAYTEATCPGMFSHSAGLGPIFQQLKQQGPFPVATSGFSPVPQGFYTGGMGLEYPVPVYGDVYVQNPFKLNEYRISAKIDYALSNKDQLSFIYLNQTADSYYPFGGGGGDIGPPSVNDGRGQNVALSWNRSFSATVANSFKVSFLRHRSDFPMTEGYDGIPMILTAFDPITVGFGMSSGLPQFFTDNQFQYQDHLSVIKGKHSFKGGAEYRRTRNGSSFFNDVSGTYYPYGIEDWVTDMAFSDEMDLALFGEPAYGSMYYASASLDPTSGNAPDVYRGFRGNEFALYFQDDWRLSSRLTVNWGLRYEYFGPPHNYKAGIDSNFYFGTNITPIATASTNPFFPIDNSFYAAVSTGRFSTRDQEIWNKDTNNFAPRLGFAFDVLGNQKLVLRAGAGVMYDRIYNNVFENIRFNPPYFSDNMIGTYANGNPSGALSTPGILTVPFSSREIFNSPTYAPKPNPRHMDQNMVSPYYQQYHLGLQWEFYKGYVFEPEYIATVGRKLIGYYDINTFNGRVSGAGSTTRINTTIGADNYRNNNFSSNYHAMQLTLRRNYAAGLGFNASYTWSRALDDLSDLFNGRGPTSGPTDTMNPKGDYGPADFHMKHRFVGTFSYELPFFKANRYLGGWNLNTIISMQSGVPFTPYSISSSYDANKDGRNTDRLVYIGSGSPMDSVTDSGSAADSYYDIDQWSRYTCPSSVNEGRWCNPPSTRGSMTGPAYQNVDFQIQKQFKITEEVKLSLMGNFFNLFNHTNFNLPTAEETSSSYGRSVSAYSPRVTQLAFRIDF